MGILDRKISERTVADLHISVATDLGIESLIGTNPNLEPVSRAPVLDTQLVMINLRTMIRNIYGAVEGEVKKQLTAIPVFNALVEEMQIIESTINRASEGLVNVLFYSCSYASLKRKFPQGSLRQISTDIQIHYSHLERDTLKLLMQMSPAHDVRYFDVDIEGRYPDTTIITHQCVDLLSKSNFTKLTLLETHTGSFKTQYQWNTKLTKGKDLVRMPFCKFTLQVFGDNGYLFAPQSNAIKEVVLKMAEDDKWTAVSTRERIVASINKVSDSKMRSQLLMLL